MKYLKDYKDGDRFFDIYLCKHKVSAVTKNGKPYESVILQDKTGTIDGKIWDPNNAGIADFDALDYIEVYGDVTSFQGALQVNVKRIRKCSEEEVNPSDYLPVSKYDIEEMYTELLKYIHSIQNPYLKQLLSRFFIEDNDFIAAFKKSSAAKTVHHGFVGGLLQHTLSVTRMCDYYCKNYERLNRDLLLTAAICHDMGKTKELSAFPQNDYTDEGQFLLASELKHCILAHHGEYEFGSPKKPAIMEAVALNFADNTDAKLQTFTELMDNTTETGWLGFNRLFDSNVIGTKVE